MIQGFLYIALPYIALLTAVSAGLHRYFTNRYSYSSLSSQLLESGKLFWGSVPWHYGIILILLAHLGAGLFPSLAAAVLRNRIALVVLELAGMALALLALYGLVVLIVRRMPAGSTPRAATSAMDWILLVCLLAQVATGLLTALFSRWGSEWYLRAMVPWFWSIVSLRPQPDTVAFLPGWIRFHMVFGWIIILLFPFTRLVHIFTVPVTYFWRPYQVVIWNRAPRRGGRDRSPGADGGSGGRPGDPLAAGDPPDDPPGDPRADPSDDPPDDRPGGSDRPESRRRFLTRMGLLAGGLGAVLVGVPSALFLLFGGLRKPPQVWRSVGDLDSFQIGSTVRVAFLDSSPLPWSGVTAQTAAWLRRESEDRFIAFSVDCTHLGCPVRWLPDANLFMCPCHGGVFYADGRPASGPPPRPLVTYPVRVRDGMVEILTSPLPIMS